MAKSIEAKRRAKAAYRCRKLGIDPGQEITARRQYPTAPVEQALAAYDPAEQARRIGTTRDGWEKARSRGQITEPTADRWATALGLHPSQLWPEWWNPIGAAS